MYHVLGFSYTDRYPGGGKIVGIIDAFICMNICLHSCMYACMHCGMHVSVDLPVSQFMCLSFGHLSALHLIVNSTIITSRIMQQHMLPTQAAHTDRPCT